MAGLGDSMTAIAFALGGLIPTGIIAALFAEVAVRQSPCAMCAESHMRPAKELLPVHGNWRGAPDESNHGVEPLFPSGFDP
jgi:hypothetical protein